MGSRTQQTQAPWTCPTIHARFEGLFGFLEFASVFVRQMGDLAVGVATTHTKSLSWHVAICASSTTYKIISEKLMIPSLGLLFMRETFHI